jgi:hypothetical protein
MRGDPRQRLSDRRSIEGASIDRGLMFAGLMLFVVAAAFIAGLYVGMHR